MQRAISRPTLDVTGGLGLDPRDVTVKRHEQ